MTDVQRSTILRSVQHPAGGSKSPSSRGQWAGGGGESGVEDYIQNPFASPPYLTPRVIRR